MAREGAERHDGGTVPGKGMVVTDLDGTLLQRDHTASPTDLATLHLLGCDGVLRVIATGRSLFSARKVLPESFPVDYLVFSSGAGIVDWRTRELVKKHDMERRAAARAVEALKLRRLDFMVHGPVPDNHFFVYYETGRENPDFSRRLAIYREFSTKADYSAPFHGPACQLVAVEPPGRGLALKAELQRELHPLQVIRTTSPIDGSSTWLEIFPPEVGKARAAEWVAEREGVDPGRILALGNDYNDLDLLEWAPAGFIVANAPEDLKSRFRTVGSHDESGFTEAVTEWGGRGWTHGRS